MINTNLHVYGSNYDPTHTTTLRNLYSRDMDHRFNELASIVTASIVDNDCFGLQGLQTHQMTPAAWQAFNYRLSQEKITEFMKWLQQQIDAGILDVQTFEQLGNPANFAWANKYLIDSYKRGVIRARYELQRAGFNVPSIDASGGIALAISTPFHLDRIGLIYSRAYSDLVGITQQMSTLISRVLAQGMADGDGPILLARKIVAVIKGVGSDLGLTDTLGRFITAKNRSETLARTEVIRAHHIATIQEYRNWGVMGIKVLGEWQTAGDDRVCPICAALQGKVYTLDQIEGMIPQHPNCRCLALPLLQS
jgi:SPP1 gp7 family putative phage head morphogenesis protein